MNTLLKDVFIVNPIYEKLFNTYCESVLREADNFDNDAVSRFLDKLPLDRHTKTLLNDAFFDHYIQWSTDAFAVGLHLGLSLLHDEVRRGGPQQVQ